MTDARIELRPRSRVRWPLALVAGVVALGWAAWSWRADEPDERSELERTIDEVVEREMREQGIAGVSIGVSRGLRIIRARGYGFADLENGVEADAETVYQVGSITKQFTAAAVLAAAEEGTIDLRAPITRYLAEFGAFSDVTVEHLLSHTGGVKNYTTFASWWGGLALEVTPRSLTDFFRDAPLDFPPGTRFAYSNSGYVLLGLMLESVSGLRFGGLLNERLFTTHRLDRTAFCDDRLLVPNRARGYRSTAVGFEHAAYVSMSQAYAAGGVCSSAMDLLRWSRALHHGAVVDERSYREMTTARTLPDGTRIEYGYGLAIGYVQGHHRFTHVGGMLGFAGQLSYYDEEDLAIAVLANTEGANAARIEREIARIVLGLDTDRTLDLPLSPVALQRYVGTYDLGLTSVDVVAEEGRLVVDVTLRGAEGRYVLLHQGDHRFRARDDAEIELLFTVADGRATEAEVVRRGMTARAVRVE